MTIDEIYQAVTHYAETGELPAGDAGLVIKFIAEWIVHATLHDPAPTLGDTATRFADGVFTLLADARR